MQIILLERGAKLGQMGEVVKVKDGYARNFLLPQGKALRANAANIARFESEKAQLEASNLESRKEAASAAEKLEGLTFVVIRSASDGGALYGSVTNRDIAEAATAGGFSLDKRQVLELFLLLLGRLPPLTEEDHQAEADNLNTHTTVRTSGPLEPKGSEPIVPVTRYKAKSIFVCSDSET